VLFGAHGRWREKRLQTATTRRPATKNINPAPLVPVLPLFLILPYIVRVGLCRKHVHQERWEPGAPGEAYAVGGRRRRQGDLAEGKDGKKCRRRIDHMNGAEGAEEETERTRGGTGRGSLHRAYTDNDGVVA